MKQSLFISLLVIVAFPIWAQQSAGRQQRKMIDSIKMSYLRVWALKYPVLRQAGVTSEVIGGSYIMSKLNKKDFLRGTGQITRIRAFANVPIIDSRIGVFSATFGYLNQQMDIRKVVSYNPQIPVADQRINLQTFKFQANYSLRDSMFGKPVSVSASISYLTEETFSRKRFNYLGFVVFDITRTATSSLSLGAGLIIDPSSPVPVVPLVNYWKKFSESDWELLVTLPSSITFRRQYSDNLSIAFGTEMGGNLMFFHFNNPYMPENSIYTTLELKTGPTIEYKLGNRIVLGINGGLLNTFGSDILEENGKTKNAFIKNKMSAVPYISASISLLPFLKGF